MTRLEAIFVSDWNAFGHDDLSPDILEDKQPEAPDGAAAQLLGTGPYLPDDAVERILLDAMYAAEREIWIATPYFVPPRSLQLALAQAACRGVAVHLCLPERADQVLVRHASPSYFGVLLKDGVHIHQYMKGMLHSKLLSIDGEFGLMGSLNMDRRSFCLNFEVSLAIYDPRLARELETIIRAYIDAGRELTEEEVANWPIWKKLQQGLARLLAPYL